MGLALLVDAPRTAVRLGRRWIGSGHPQLAGVEDRLIPGPGGPLPIRMYRPSGLAPLPVLVFCHGGGWAHGTLDSYDGLCRAIAGTSGWMIISVGYRLAPAAKFPAALEDAYAAVHWVAVEAGTIGADPRCLAIGGDSAGGNLAAAVALLARDRGGPRLAFQVLVYPALDSALETASYGENEGYGPSRAEMQALWSGYLPTDTAGSDPYASPLRTKDPAELPPALIITAELDTLRDEGEAYAARLRAADVPVALRRYPDARHAFMTVSDSALRRQAIGEMAAALQAACPQFARPGG